MIRKIIAGYNDRDSIYGNKLTNHLNMGLFALYRMGASRTRLDDFARGYIADTELAPQNPPSCEINDGNFEDCLGHDGNYSAFISYFKIKLKKEAPEAVLKKFINRLLPGEAGGAFHGLIRLAYAIELDDPEELIKALAYMAEAYTPFPLPAALPIQEPLEAITALSKDEGFINFSFHRSLIIGRMRDIYDNPRFAGLVTDMPENLYTDRSMADLMLNLYRLTEDFTVLHGFTSTHALRIIRRYLNDYPAALRRHWRLIQLAYLSTGCSPLQGGNPIDSPESWESIFEKACLSRDVHTFKLVYSLSEQAKIAGNDRPYRAAAQSKAGF